MNIDLEILSSSNRILSIEIEIIEIKNSDNNISSSINLFIYIILENSVLILKYL